MRAAQEIGALHWRLPQDPRTEKVSSATLGQGPAASSLTPRQMWAMGHPYTYLRG